MSENVTVIHYNPIGIQHEERITGDRIVLSVRGTNATVRVYDRAGRVVRVHCYTGVAETLWEETK